MTATLDRKTFREAVYYRGKAQTVDEAGRLLHALHGGDVGPWHLCAHPTCAVLQGLAEQGEAESVEYDTKINDLADAIDDLMSELDDLYRSIDGLRDELRNIKKGKKK